MKQINFRNITEFNKAQDLPEPENPLFTVGMKILDDNEISNCVSTNNELIYSNQFYIISLKNIVSGEIVYGRTRYDSSKGTLLFSSPNQTYKVKDIVISKESWFIAFHEDFVRNNNIYKLIKKSNFFNYNVNEALHLSPKEESIIKSIFKNIEIEYQNNQDKLSKEIILSHLEALLKYSERFYNRQFLNRKDLNKSIIEKFTELLDSYFENGKQLDHGIPSVKWLANQLNISQRYLSDTIKSESGFTAVDYVNLYLVEEAKNLLLKPNSSISETAYGLGFEYPQYFSRLFKNKTGITPTQFIKKYSKN